LPAHFQFLQREIVLLDGRHAASPLVNVFLLCSICLTRMNQSSLIHKFHIPDKTMSTTIADRLRARAEQMGLNAREVAEQARVNRSFVYDIMRGRSERPNIEKLDKVAAIIKVDRNWLLHGKGVVDGDEPDMEVADPFVAIPSVAVTASM